MAVGKIKHNKPASKRTFLDELEAIPYEITEEELSSMDPYMKKILFGIEGKPMQKFTDRKKTSELGQQEKSTHTVDVIKQTKPVSKRSFLDELEPIRYQITEKELAKMNPRMKKILFGIEEPKARAKETASEDKPATGPKPASQGRRLLQRSFVDALDPIPIEISAEELASMDPEMKQALLAGRNMK